MIHMTEQELMKKKPNIDLNYEVIERQPIKDDIEDIEEIESHLNPSISLQNLTVIKGIGSSVEKQLYEINIMTVNDLAATTPEQLSDLKGIGLLKAQMIIEEAKLHLRTRNLNEFSDSFNTVSPENIKEEVLEMASLTQNVIDHNVLEPEVVEVHEYDSENILDDYNEANEETNYFEEEKKEENGINIAQSEFQDTQSPTFETETFETESEDQENQEVEFIPPVLEHPNKEVISSEKLQQVEDKIRERLEELEFLIIEKNNHLQDITSNIDILAVKYISHFEYGKKIKRTLSDLVIIIPIKISNLKGPLVVSLDAIKYTAIEGGNDFYNKSLPMSFIDTLNTTKKAIQTNLLQKGSLFALFNEILPNTFSLRKTSTKKNLYFYSGGVQYEVLIEPLIISENSVGFAEKVLPFAYHKDSNIHVIQLAHFSEFLEYVEKKFCLIESYTKRQNLFTVQCDAANKLSKRLLFLLSFGCMGLLYITVLFFQAYSILHFINNISFGALCLLGIISSYLLLGYFRHISYITHEFATPYYKRDLHLDNSSLKLINQRLTPTLMEQFSYECLGKNHGRKFIEKIEQENARNYLTNKIVNRKVKEVALFEDEDTPPKSTHRDTESKNGLKEKYSSFLED